MRLLPTIAALASVAAAQSLTITSISDAQASALSAPLSAYLAKVEASPGFFSVVQEIAQATAKPDATLGSGAPSAAEFPAFAQELNAVAAQDAVVVGSLPASARAFLAQAAKGEIAVIESVLGSGDAPSTTGGAALATSAAAGRSSAAAPFVRPTGTASLSASASAGANSSAPNASHVMAPIPSQSAGAKHISTGDAACTTAMSAGMLGLVMAIWVGFA